MARRGVKATAKQWLPDEAVRLARHWAGYGSHFRGTYDTWEAAAENVGGYDSGNILDRVEQATAAVCDGRATFERDGVLFDTADLPYPLLAGLLRAAAQDGRLHVVDFGGALGSTYHQCRRFIEAVPDVRWQVVEQPHFVARGRAKFSDGVLDFADSIEEAFRAIAPNVALASGVLQYVPHPGEVLDELARRDIGYILIDRTPIVAGARETLARQLVSSRVVNASYPVRLFTQESLLAPLAGRYELIAEFDALDNPMGGLRRRVDFKGFLLQRKRG
ncbi:MAG: methyltransferase, TIGR04325 family [Rhizobiales bacterium]|nr:methyltransferase, TIGR04325 family [Hyphomicrobiales bacterium]